MCGICGFFSLQNKSRMDESFIDRMNQEMYLRGPDGGGIWIEKENRCGFGHRRLSIVDLAPEAAQPMTNHNEHIVITFNGEIYNHDEIKDELNKFGNYQWKTDHSDTEMIIHAYEQWGIRCIEKFRGMFAFALWDGYKKECYLVRDRLGIKPLYYMEDDGRLIFSSEMKTLCCVRKTKSEINERSMYDYLSFLSTPGEETLIRGIKKIPAATYLVYTENGLQRKERYWDVWDHTRSELYTADSETISEAIISELRTSVNYRKRSDVPVGIFLSGGVDSSTNAALFSEGEKQKVKAFCIGYNRNYSAYKNENDYAKRMADYCGAEYYERILNEDELFEFLPLMAKLQDEPIADPTCFPSYYVSKLARDNGIIVAQVGEGSDELFWGYRRWKAYLKLSQIDEVCMPKSIKKIGLSVLKAIGKGNRDYTELLRRSICDEPIFWSGAEGFHEYDKQHLLSSKLRIQFKGYNSFESLKPTYERFMEKAWEKSYVNWMGYADLNHRIPELLLMRVDKMSMANSLECRVPFLDHKFVELAMSIPQSKKTEEGVNKIVLKKAVRGIIPDEVIDRKKQGFTAPVYDWFLGKLKGRMLNDILEFSDATNYFDENYIKKLFESQVNAKKIWYLFNLALWWREYIAV